MADEATLGGLRREGGNTQNPLPPHKKSTQVPKRKNHFFTWNNYTEEQIGGILTYFNEHATKYAFQEELCPTTGTPHLQGMVMFPDEKRSTIWDPQSKGHWEALKKTDAVYQLKDKTRKPNGRQWSKGLPKPLRLITNLYPWQEECKKILTSGQYDDRKIYWYWEPTGNIGKSQFAKYMYVHHKTLYLGSGKYADLMNLVFNADMDICESIIFDIPRCQKDHISYAALESIKVGLITNTKYETGMKVFNPPIVMVFANCEPDLTDDNLSRDRWIIKRLPSPLMKMAEPLPKNEEDDSGSDESFESCI